MGGHRKFKIQKSKIKMTKKLLIFIIILAVLLGFYFVYNYFTQPIVKAPTSFQGPSGPPSIKGPSGPPPTRE